MSERGHICIYLKESLRHFLGVKGHAEGKGHSMDIVVLAGGLSPERDVSFTGGGMIAAALIDRGHRVCLCDPYTGMGADGAEPYFADSPLPPEADQGIGREAPDLDRLKATSGRGELRIAPGVIDLCRRADMVFVALHGDVGEDGRLQALLDMEAIPHTGSGYAGCLLAMDKDISKQLFRQAGILTPDWVRCDLSRMSPEAAVSRIKDEIGTPCVIKPCSCGSSVGVTLVDTEEELVAAVTAAGRFGTDILAERRIIGRELTVSVLGRRVLPAVEILPHEGFYDYENKYRPGAVEEICPADLTLPVASALADAAQRGFDVLRLTGYARFDFMLDADGTPWCLEANALPGMTGTSLLPRAAAAIGLDYPSLCEEILRLAMTKR